MSDVNSALDSLASLAEGSNDWNLVPSVSRLKEVKQPIVRSLVSSSIVQYSSLIDTKGMVGSPTLKELDKLGISAKWKMESAGIGSEVIIQVLQDGRLLGVKSVKFLPSKDNIKGLSENTEYSESSLLDAYGRIAAGALYVVGVSAGLVGMNVAFETIADQVLDQSVSSASQGLIGTAATQGLVSTSTTELAQTGLNEVVVKSAGVNAITTVGGVVNAGLSQAVTIGGQVATKVGVQGATEAAKTAATALATDGAKLLSGNVVLLLVVCGGTAAILNSCQYVPKIYHFCDGENKYMSYCLMKNSDTLQAQILSKEARSANSILVVSRDVFTKPLAPLQAFPIAPKKARKDLYGLYFTTSTGWPKSKERNQQVMDKLKELSKNLM